MPVLMLTWTALAALSACGQERPEWCADRADDGDCDGVPDDVDQCPGTTLDLATDRVGCSPDQAAGCAVQVVAPDDGEKLGALDGGPASFRWTGTCDVYLVQLSADPGFPVGATWTVGRTTGQELGAPLPADLDGRAFWRVVGGQAGRSTGATSSPRELSWR